MNIREIPLSGWTREKLFRSYLGSDFPHIILGARVDVTRLLALCRREEALSFYFTLVHLCTKTADGIVNFRYRFEDERVFEIEYNRPVLTHIRPGESDFIMLEGPHTDDPFEFCRVLNARAKDRAPGERLDAGGEHTLISYSCMPWIDYTHFVRTIMRAGRDCNPKISWGKYVTENGRTSLNLSVQTHHGLMDGLHVGLFYERLQAALDAL